MNFMIINLIVSIIKKIDNKKGLKINYIYYTMYEVSN